MFTRLHIVLAASDKLVKKATHCYGKVFPCEPQKAIHINFLLQKKFMNVYLALRP